MGFDLYAQLAYGAPKIGLIFAQIMKGFGCQLLGYDPDSSLQNWWEICRVA